MAAKSNQMKWHQRQSVKYGENIENIERQQAAYQ
jgi:hypothetical protein